jgi:hypothetical protein
MKRKKRGLAMVNKRYRREFERDGVEAVRKQVELASYTDPEKHQQTVAWLDQQDPARKTYRAVKKQLVLARRTATKTRLTLVVAAIILIILILAVAKIFAAGDWLG